MADRPPWEDEYPSPSASPSASAPADTSSPTPSPTPSASPPWQDTYQGDNLPPPGVIIHEANRSYVTGPGGPSVDTTNMTQDQRQIAAAALQMRQNPDQVPGRVLVGPPQDRPAYQGLTFGYGDEPISAGYAAGQWLRGKPFGESYAVAQEAQRQELEQQRAEHPYLSTGTEIGGSLLSGIPISRALPALGEGASLLQRIGYGALQGAGYGGVQGFGSGSGLDDRLEKAKEGAGWGAAAGAVAAPVADVASSAYRWLADKATVARNLANLGLSRAAGDTVLRVASADDALTGAGSARILAGGPDAMLVDAGPAQRGLLDSITQQTGGATRIANEAVADRLGRANQAFRGSLDTAFGQPQGLDSTVLGIRQSSEAARDAAYKAAHAAPIDWSNPAAADLNAALTRVPQGSSAINRANELLTTWEGPAGGQIGRAPNGRLMAGTDAQTRIGQLQNALDGAPPNMKVAIVNEINQLQRTGATTFDQPLNTQQLDYLTRALRDISESGETMGAMGGPSSASAGYGKLVGDIRGAMRQLVPEYGVALDTAADPISRIAATRAGATALGPNVTRDQVALTLQNMSPGERQAYMQAVRSNLDDRMANVRYAASRPDYDAKQLSDTLGQMNSQAAREKFAMMLNDPAATDQLMTGIGHASTAAELSAAMSRNSATFARKAASDAEKQMAAPGVIGSATRGYPMQTGQRMVQRLFGTTPQDDLLAQDLRHEQIARVLTGPRGPDALDQLQRLTDAYHVGQTNQAAAENVRRVVDPATGLAMYQLTPGLLGMLGLPFGSNR